jgi:hypothetical protein
MAQIRGKKCRGRGHCKSLQVVAGVIKAFRAGGRENMKTCNDCGQKGAFDEKNAPGKKCPTEMVRSRDHLVPTRSGGQETLDPAAPVA